MVSVNSLSPFSIYFYSLFIVFPLVASFCLLITYKNSCFQAKPYILSGIIYLILVVALMQRDRADLLLSIFDQLKAPLSAVCPGVSVNLSVKAEDGF